MLQSLAFVLTLAIELPVAAVFRALARLDVPWTRVLAVAAAGTAVTHPVVWWLVSDALREWPYLLRLGTAELFAVVVEALLFATVGRVPATLAIALSLSINLASVAVGLLFNAQILALARVLA